MYDIIIIGGGVVGGTTAARLSRCNLKIAVLEQQIKVAMGNSKYNMAIVHGGYAEPFGTLKARLCLQGNQKFERIQQKIDFGFVETGSMVVALQENQKYEIHRMFYNAEDMGLTGVKILTAKQAKAIEPAIHPDVKGALYYPRAGLCSPYQMTNVMMNHATQNSVELFVDHQVVSIKKEKDYFYVSCSNGDLYKSKYIVNATGNNWTIVNEIAGIGQQFTPREIGKKINIQAGVDKDTKNIILQLPGKNTKGRLTTPLVKTKNNNAIQLYSLYQHTLTKDSFINFDYLVKNFEGITNIGTSYDFVIEEDLYLKNFVEVSSIESPGVTAAPAIALRISGILADIGLDLKPNPDYNPRIASRYSKDRKFI